MGYHPIESLMKTTMDSLKAMIDVNTVVGDPVETKDGSVIIPVSRVSFGFVTGGGDETVAGAGGDGSGGSGESGDSRRTGQEQPGSGDAFDQVQGPGTGDSTGMCESAPFAGGTGAGVSVRPVGFLVVGERKVRFLPVDSRALLDRLIEEAPGLLDRLTGAVEKRRDDACREMDRGRRQRRGEVEDDRRGTEWDG